MTVNNYFTLQDVKDRMPENAVSQTTFWDLYVTDLIPEISRSWDTLTFRQPGDYAVSDNVARLFDGVPPTARAFVRTLFLGEVVGTPSLVEINVNGDGTTWVSLPSTDYFLRPTPNLYTGKPFNFIDLNRNGTTRCWPQWQQSVRITGYFGYSRTVPADVFNGVLLFVIKFVRKAQQNYLETGTLLDSGQVMNGMKVDEDLAQILHRYEFWTDGARTALSGAGW